MLEILTISEASAFTRLKPATLYAYVAARRVPFLKIGSRVLFSRNELESWVAAHRVPALTAKG